MLILVPCWIELRHIPGRDSQILSSVYSHKTQMLIECLRCSPIGIAIPIGGRSNILLFLHVRQHEKHLLPGNMLLLAITAGQGLGQRRQPLSEFLRLHQLRVISEGQDPTEDAISIGETAGKL